MSLGPTRGNDNRQRRHPRVSGGPRQAGNWIPAFAGMTHWGRFSGERGERWRGRLAPCGVSVSLPHHGGLIVTGKGQNEIEDGVTGALA
jgi:hypothetical protein